MDFFPPSLTLNLELWFSPSEKRLVQAEFDTEDFSFILGH